MRRNALPPKPEDYKAATSPNFKPPDGVEFKLDENDPLWAQAKTWAHKNGLSQDAFLEAIDLVAGRDIATQQRVTTARNAEIAKLGTTGTARVDAIETFYKGLLGEADAKAEMSRIFTAADVVRHEKKIAKFATQGAASFTQSHRVPPEPQGRVSQEEYDRMTPAQRWDYSRSFDQRQFQNGAPQ